jgi:UDP-N-acetyl-D-glucosamine dehydrogenase
MTDTTSHTLPSPLDLVVVGQGYVGLPLAQEAVKAGLRTAGFDLSPRVVEGLNNGVSHIDDLSDEDVRRMDDAGYFATSDPDVMANATAVVICVPTPLSKDGAPEMSYVISAASTVAEKVAPGTLVSLESTTYPGTTDDLLRPLLEKRGLTVGVDVFLAFSPERINPGDPVYGFRNTPKVVGGATEACTERARHFYERIVDTVVPVSGTRSAEMAKLLENTYRHVNIALVNELARCSRGLGVDIFEVIDAAKTKPFGFQAFYPGPGVGGHCIPIDPNYLSYTIRTELGQPFRFVELAQEINNSMPSYVRMRIAETLNDECKSIRGSKILLLGVTYKANIADQRESPALPLGKLLHSAGADLRFHDPKVEQWNLGSDVTLHCEGDLDAALEEADIAVLLQPHEAYSTLVEKESLCTILDTRGFLRGRDQVVTL